MLNAYMGQRVRDLRTERGLTQTELAQRSGLADKRVVSQLELGRHTPSAATVEKLARGLGVEPGELFPKAKARSQREFEERELVAKIIAGTHRLLAELVRPAEVDPLRAEFIAGEVDGILADGLALRLLWDPEGRDPEKVPGVEALDVTLHYWAQYVLALLKGAREKEARSEEPDENRLAGLNLIIDSFERRVA